MNCLVSVLTSAGVPLLYLGLRLNLPSHAMAGAVLLTLDVAVLAGMYLQGRSTKTTVTDG